MNREDWREAWDDTRRDARPNPWSARTWGELPRFWRAQAITAIFALVSIVTHPLLPRAAWWALTGVLVLVSIAVTRYQFQRNEEERES